MSALATVVVAATLLPGLQFAIGVNATIAVAAALLLAVFLHVLRPAALAAAEPARTAD